MIILKKLSQISTLALVVFLAGCPENGTECHKHSDCVCGTCVNGCCQPVCQSGDGCCPAECNENNDSDCALPCGNWDLDEGEVCDDGNRLDGDYCSSDCKQETGSCGDGTQQDNEACDDENTVDGDYCSADCKQVTGSCGDKIIQDNEKCDDGNNDLTDDCPDGPTGTCQTAVCNDGHVQAGVEDCDGNTIANGTCTAECKMVCKHGFVDCNSNFSDGCEANLSTDAKNCGKCNNSCESGATCIDGNCLLTLADGLASPNTMVIDDSFVYLSNWGTETSLGNYNNDGSIVKISKDGSETQVLASSQLKPKSLVADADNLYWANEKEIMKVSKQGGMPVSVASSSNKPMRLALDETHLYWTEKNDQSQRTVRLSKDSTDGQAELVTTGYCGKDRITLDADYIYCAIQDGGIARVSKSGGSAEIVKVGWSPLEYVVDLATDGSYLFWLFGYMDQAEIWKKSLIESTGEIKLALMEESSGVSLFRGFVVDSSYIYWHHYVEKDVGPISVSVLRTDVEPGDTIEILSFSYPSVSGPSLRLIDIAKDDSSFYFLARSSDLGSDDGSIFRIFSGL